MIDIYICEQTKTEREKLHQYCTSYYIAQNYDGEIYLADGKEELEEQLKDYHLKALYFLDCRVISNELKNAIIKSNYNNYLIFIADRIETILDGAGPDFRPSGYMLKPVGEADTTHIIDSIYQNFQSVNKTDDSFRFKIKNRFFCIGIDKILYFESVKKKMLLRTASQEYEFYESFDNLKNQLPDCFIRTHKSFLVNMSKVESIDYTNMQIFLQDNIEVYISRSYKKEVELYMTEQEVG